MDNDSTVVLSDEPLFLTHLTDGEIASVADIALKTVQFYRCDGVLPPGERLFVERKAYSGRRVRIKKNFTHVDDVRAWFMATGRTKALVALDRLIADKAVSPEVGE